MSKNNKNKFSPGEKLTINALIFVTVLILGFLVMLVSGKMVIPL
jgi:hypothetical protein